MNLLLDTHVLIWCLDDNPKLSPKVRSTIADDATSVFISSAVVWEMCIKESIGKLRIPENLEEVLEENYFEMLPITIKHALILRNLPEHHKDPFDRILVAQAVAEDLTLVTRDRVISRYDVRLLQA